MNAKQLAEKIIKTQAETGNHIQWETSQAVSKLTPAQVLELAPEFDEWCGTDDFTPLVQRNLNDEKFMPTLKQSILSMMLAEVKNANRK